MATAATPTAARAGDLAVWCRSAGALLDAGLLLPVALAQLGTTTPGPYRAASGRLAAAARERVGLAAAIRREPALFPPLMSAILAGAEQSGKVPETLAGLADHFEAEQALENRLRAGLWVPLLAIGAVAFLGLFVAPGINASFGQGMQDLTDKPGMTLIPEAPGRIAALILLAIALWRPVLRRITPIRAVVDGLLDLVPVVAGLRRRLARSRFFSTLHMAMEAGISLPDSLVLAGDASGGARAAAQARRAASRVRNGEPLEAALQGISIVGLVGRGAISTWQASGALDGLAGVARLERSAAQVAAAGAVALAIGGATIGAGVMVLWMATSFYANQWAIVDAF